MDEITYIGVYREGWSYKKVLIENVFIFFQVIYACTLNNITGIHNAIKYFRDLKEDNKKTSGMAYTKSSVVFIN